MLIPLTDVLRYKSGASVQGVIHVGAHLGQEAEYYSENGIEKVIWIEANPKLMKPLQENLKKYPNQYAYHALISDKTAENVKFYIDNKGAFSSSHLPPDKIFNFYSGLHFDEIIELSTVRLDDFLEEQNIAWENYNFLTLDIEGAELLALKSLGSHLSGFNWIYTEVRYYSSHKGCVLLWDLDDFLNQQGFSRIKLRMTPEYWGDAVYIKKNNFWLIALWQKMWSHFYLDVYYKSWTIIKFVRSIHIFIEYKIVRDKFGSIRRRLNLRLRERLVRFFKIKNLPK